MHPDISELLKQAWAANVFMYIYTWYVCVLPKYAYIAK